MANSQINMIKSLFILLSMFLLASKPSLSQQYCHTPENYGVGGYDVVAYHTKDKALLGNEKFETEYDGIKYKFISEEHLNKFKKNPEKFLPAYGGWCSMTLAMGRATAPEYTNFHVDETGQLYLFERTLSVNGRELWLQDVPSNKEAATGNYQKHLENEL